MSMFGSPTVTITYDDGPGDFTETLLDELQALNATASFFVLTALALQRPETVRRALAEGHTVGLHSWSHPNLTALVEARDWDALTKEVDQAADVLQSITGERPFYFRPPYGAINAQLRDYLHQRGFAVAMWSSGCIDWALTDAHANVVTYVDGLADAGGVICMHDIHETSVQGTPELVAALRSSNGPWVNPQGRRIVSLDECTERVERGSAWNAR